MSLGGLKQQSCIRCSDVLVNERMSVLLKERRAGKSKAFIYSPNSGHELGRGIEGGKTVHITIVH
jgi:hypothetical protein